MTHVGFITEVAQGHNGIGSFNNTEVTQGGFNTEVTGAALSPM